MIWNSIWMAKQEKRELYHYVVWLDLTNAYGSVPHHLLYQSLNFFHIPGKFKVLLLKYSDTAFRAVYTTGRNGTDPLKGGMVPIIFLKKYPCYFVSIDAY